MVDLEIPLGKRQPLYRFFEMLPAMLSYGALILFVTLSFFSPFLAAIYLLIIVVTLLVKAVGIAFHMIQGRRKLDAAQKMNWTLRLSELEDPGASYDKHSKYSSQSTAYEMNAHLDNLLHISKNPDKFPKPSQIYNAVIVATYNESYDVLEPTIRSVLDTTYDKRHLILNIAYEERGGPATEETVRRLKEEYKNDFFAFNIIKHPGDLPNEQKGKGSNLTYAGHALSKWLKKKGIKSSNVIVTTLDADNRPHRAYFDYLTYEYIVHEDRKNLAYQPICLFLGNIWDAPAPMRVVATGNSFWNIISSMRPHTLRNFASHSQPMDALEDMNFWSVRTIVEDGHQYWRSYFHFNGDYTVLPLYVTIYQDAVLAETYLKTLKAQFLQLSRWAYGASDIAYVGTRIFTKDRNVPILGGLARFVRLIDGHVTLASVSILVAVGGWIPLLINSESARSISAHQLPDVVSMIQQVAMIGLIITIFLSFKMLPPRPERYKRHRNIAMVAQWALMPFTAILYSSSAALYAHYRLFTGKYMDKFNVTDKATAESVARAKELSRQNKNK